MAGQVTSYEEEIWKQINGYEGLYEISNLGRVRSMERFVYGKCKRVHKQRIIKLLTSGTHGYPSVSLCSNGVKKSFLIHRLVASAFLPLDPEKTYVNHINGVKSDCYAGNLEWVTNRENQTHGMLNLSKKNINIGVHKQDKGKPWRSTVYYNKKAINIGKFDTEEEAKQAYLNKLAELGIKNKYLN